MTCDAIVTAARFGSSRSRYAELEAERDDQDAVRLDDVVW